VVSLCSTAVAYQASSSDNVIGHQLPAVRVGRLVASETARVGTARGHRPKARWAFRISMPRFTDRVTLAHSIYS
jgi:hypothetical protein